MTSAYSHNVASEEDINSDFASRFRSRILDQNSFVYRRAVEFGPQELFSDLCMCIDRIKFKMQLKQVLLMRNTAYDEYIIDLSRMEDSFESNIWRNNLKGPLPIILPYDFTSFIPKVAESYSLWIQENATCADIAPEKLTLKHHEVFEKYSTSKLMHEEDQRLAFNSIFFFYR